MAELILRIFFNSLAGRALSSLFDEIGLTRGVQSEFNDLVNSLSFIRGYLQDAEKRRVDEEALKVWLKQLQDLAYEADDLLDDFNTEIIRRRSVAGGNKKMVNEVSIFFSSSNQFIYANRMAHRITDLKKKVDALSEGRERFHLKMISENLSLEECHHKRPLTVSSDYERYVIGRDEDKNDVINFLLNPNFDENLSILSIVGFGGTGKTTLARLVYKDERLKDHFPLKIWVCVSTNFVVEDILRNLIRECSPESRKDKIAHLQMNDLHDKLREELGEKMFLIVLDDVWNEDRNKWLELENHIPYGAKGSKMLVTTRSSLVANIMVKTSHKSHNLSGLPEEESLTLLMKMAGKEEDEWKNKNLEKIAKGILKKCGGFPLAIMTIGRLLSTRVEAKWSDLLEEDFSRIEQKEGDIMPTLKISYDFLPSHLKQCFAYCCLFPKDYELDPNELVRLWMAQGFILKSSTTSRKTLHDVGKEYFMELASRSFFQDLERDQLGNIKGCKMHDLMHDLATMVACGSCTTIVKDGSGAGYEDIPKEVRHVSMVVDMGSYNLKSLESLGRDILSFRNYSFDMDVDMGADMGVDRGSYNLKSLEPNQRIIRSLLFINQYQDINSFGGDISSFRNLRALRLHRLAKAEGDVLRSIGKLKHLRSLDLSWSRELTSLPNSIGKLLNLETLILYRCQNLESLPREVTKLINLRHLNVKGCGSLTHMPRGIGNLTNLEELSLFRVGKTGKWNGARMDELRGLTGLREELTIDHLWGLEESDSILTCDADSTAYYLIDKSRLKRLHLSWERWYWGRGADDPSEYAEEVLERLKPNLDLLKSLTIYYYPGTTLPSWTSLLHNLVEIEIEDCNNIRSIPPLDQLSWLESIKLSDCNNIRSIPPLDQLSSLESIKLRNCNNIRSIPPLDQLSSLESISLYDCNNIRSIPPLDQLPSLKSIWFDVLQELEWIEVTENSICLYPSLEEVSLRNLPMFKGWKRKRMEVNRSGDQSIHSSSSSSPPLFFIPSFSKNSRQVNDQLFRCEMLSYMWDNNQELILSGMKYKDLEEEMWRRNRRNLEEEEEEEEEEEVMVTQMGSLKILPLSSVPLHLLTSLSLHYLEDTEHLPMELFQSLSRLQSLKITKCHHIRSIPPLDQLSSLESIKLKYLRKLEWIEVTENSICLYLLVSVTGKNRPSQPSYVQGMEEDGGK
ncbi:hypothetical protein SAY87_015270 [Trapa incisa]|uniref:Disease resistance protein RGA3 n=1 Tax=Trapa incisa TaxID=236973 RepID=A0AAN7GTY7_9MYRT|nr:hypothetical protein SAY87_015270 [Trapa incisa]